MKDTMAKSVDKAVAKAPPKKVDPIKVDPMKVDPKKDDPIKVDPKKVDDQNVVVKKDDYMKRRLQEVGHRSDPQDMKIVKGVEAFKLYIQGFHLHMEKNVTFKDVGHQCVLEMEDISDELHMKMKAIGKAYLNETVDRELLAKLDDVVLDFMKTDCGS